MIKRSRPGGLPCGLALTMLLAQLACGKATSGRLDSESHFVCVVDADCVALAGASCVGGSCSVAESPSETGLDPAPAATGANLPTLTPSAAPAFDDCPMPTGVEIGDQPTLDGLEGCTLIAGNLHIVFEADLRPLHALRGVSGSMSIQPALGRQPSLEGLENLEHIGGDLLLKSLSVSSLASLASLSALATLPGSQGLTIEDCVNLRDFAGLEGIAELRGLRATSNPQLATLAPLRFSDPLDNLVLEDDPLLTDLTALRPVTVINEWTLARSSLEDLDAFSGLRRVGELSLLDNALLTDTSSLLRIQAIQGLTLAGNAKLESVVLSTYLTGLSMLRMVDNPALTQISGLDHLLALGYVLAVDNPLLRSLSFVGLQSLPVLEVIRNPSLAELDLGGASLHNVVVVSNPSLPFDSAFNAFQSKVAGNQGQPTGFTPCPFERDGYCDAAPRDTLCAAGTDAVDCSSEISPLDR